MRLGAAAAADPAATAAAVAAGGVTGVVGVVAAPAAAAPANDAAFGERLQEFASANITISRGAAQYDTPADDVFNEMHI